jgi:hypothetical protein
MTTPARTPATKSGTRKGAAAPSPPIKAPNPPEEEVDDRNIPDEIPKMGSRDALGG